MASVAAIASLVSGGFSLIGYFTERQENIEAANAAILQLKAEREYIEGLIDQVAADLAREIGNAEELLAEEESRVADEIIDTEEEYRRQKTQEEAAYKIASGKILQQIEDLLVARSLVIEDFETQKKYFTAQYETDKAYLDESYANAVAEIDDEIANLMENRTADLADVEREMQNLIETRDLNLSQLEALASSADTEAQRQIQQIQDDTELLLSSTTDAAVLEANSYVASAIYDVGETVYEEKLSASATRAAAAASGTRRSGSPLLAIRQQEQRSYAAIDNASNTATAYVQGLATNLSATIVQYRAEASDNIEDILAENALYDQELEQQRQDIENAFNQEYENLEASIDDIERQYKQELAAYNAEKSALSENYQYEAENLYLTYQSNLASLENDQLQYEQQYLAEKTALETEMEATTTAYEDTLENLLATRDATIDAFNDELSAYRTKIEQATESLQAEATALTEGYEYQLEQIETQIDYLRENKTSINAATSLAVVGTVTETTLDTLASYLG